MNSPKKRESLLHPRPVAPLGARHVLRHERRRERGWTTDERNRFLFHLATEETLERALCIAAVSNVEANAERLRSKAFARAWDRAVQDKIARLPERLYESVIRGLAGDFDPRNSAIRQACGVGLHLLQHCLPPPMSGPSPSKCRGQRTGSGTISAPGPDGEFAAQTDEEAERLFEARLAEVRAAILATNPFTGLPFDVPGSD